MGLFDRIIGKRSPESTEAAAPRSMAAMDAPTEPVPTQGRMPRHPDAENALWLWLDLGLEVRPGVSRANVLESAVGSPVRDMMLATVPGDAGASMPCLRYVYALPSSAPGDHITGWEQIIWDMAEAVGRAEDVTQIEGTPTGDAQFANIRFTVAGREYSFVPERTPTSVDGRVVEQVARVLCPADRAVTLTPEGDVILWLRKDRLRRYEEEARPQL